MISREQKLLILAIVLLSLTLGWQVAMVTRLKGEFRSGYVIGHMEGRADGLRYAEVRTMEAIEKSFQLAMQRLAIRADRSEAAAEAYLQVQREDARDGLGWATGVSNAPAPEAAE